MRNQTLARKEESQAIDSFDDVAQFEAIAEQLVWPQTSWVGNAWVDCGTQQTMPLRRSPVDGRILPALFEGDMALVDDAVSQARSAFHRGDWAHLSPASRKQVLLQMAVLLEAHATELCVMDCLSMGKPYARLVQQDAVKAAECFRWFAEWIDKVQGEYVPANGERIGWVEKTPLGVVAAITPWNYPLENIAWKLAPALAAGNCVVLKPAEQSSYSALRFAQLAAQAGLPAHVLNVVVGSGETVGQYLVEHPDVSAVFFTGSSRTGRTVCNSASRHRIKPVSVECGGKSPALIWHGCSNLQEAVEEVCGRVFGNAGQTCNAPSRLIVARPLLDQVRQIIVGISGTHVPCDPRVGRPQHGALCSHFDVERIDALVRTATDEGAELWVGGSPADVVPGGAYYLPTVLGNVAPHGALAQQEVFGPVLSVFTVDHLDDAIALANDSRYALAAGIYTDHLGDALAFQRGVYAGNVYINGWGMDDISVPFGGLGDSGNGTKDKGLRAFEKCFASRSITICTKRRAPGPT
ncbi:aldehyde dehydrogenase family protein [Curvibacter sp. APW13]|uniref:aldehyde dehydrogenase family protein n=1 Tax=Curvibacter sp. APW13 TaxID=3077236 RepID=UPI0028E05CC9|nr:aldehyde dehydrogenase family protein [Curvibacter sp. APW13]MDT8993014.1 aldehyde dehydrogenase family protein [Curvibacter sp. APW13]